MFSTVTLYVLAFFVVFVMTCINLNDFNTYKCKGKTLSLVGEDADDITKAELVVVTVGPILAITCFVNATKQIMMKKENVSPLYIILSSSLLLAAAIILAKASKRYKEVAEGCPGLEESVERNNRFFIGMVILISLEVIVLIGSIRLKASKNG